MIDYIKRKYRKLRYGTELTSSDIQKLLEVLYDIEKLERGLRVIANSGIKWGAKDE